MVPPVAVVVTQNGLVRTNCICQNWISQV